MPSAGGTALVGEMYGVADWRADEEDGRGLAPASPEEEQRSEEDAEW
ncbi:MAG TPA: hypothetical protein VLO07_05575 [Thermoanaerobaculia bacterium]|nr:hypothetical protein [Thermoanaerobaculia bacterium]